MNNIRNHKNANNLSSSRIQEMENLPSWQWQAELRTKKISDTCPKCKQIIEFDQANAKDLNNEHDNGKGGTCRFRGAVVEGKIQQNIDEVFTKKCSKCREEKIEGEHHENEWKKSGAHANRRKCKKCQSGK